MQGANNINWATSVISSGFCQWHRVNKSPYKEISQRMYKALFVPRTVRKIQYNLNSCVYLYVTRKQNHNVANSMGIVTAVGVNNVLLQAEPACTSCSLPSRRNQVNELSRSKRALWAQGHPRQTPSIRNGCCVSSNKLNPVALVRTRTIPTERPPPVGEVSANFCG